MRPLNFRSFTFARPPHERPLFYIGGHGTMPDHYKKNQAIASFLRLNYSPGASSLAAHIALRESGLPFVLSEVELPDRMVDGSQECLAFDRMNDVPALDLGNNTVLQDSVAALSFIAKESPHLLPDGKMGLWHLIDRLGFIASELHKPLVRMMFSDNLDERAQLNNVITPGFEKLGTSMEGNYLLGDKFTPADAYLYVMTRWAEVLDCNLPEAVKHLASIVEARPTAHAALSAEGLRV